MRTTLTLDPDVAQELKARAERTHTTLKRVVNEALRRGLSAERRPKVAAFRVAPHSFGFRAGVDTHKLGQLADELESQASASAAAPANKRRA